MADPLLFVDLETSGLNKNTDLVLELAMAYVSPEGARHLFSSLVLAPGLSGPETVADVRENADPFVVGMHTANGLLDALGSIAAPEEHTPRAVQERAVRWLERLPLPSLFDKEGKAVLVPAGYSVGFDRDFIGVAFPAIRSRLHAYRLRDVTAIARFLHEETGVDTKGDTHGEGMHRALADTLHVVDTYQACQALVRGRQ